MKITKNKCNCCGRMWNGKEWVGDHEYGCPAYYDDESVSPSSEDEE